MTCSDVERVLPEYLDRAPEDGSQTAFEIHVRSCQACSDLISDLKLIAKEAGQMSATEEPASRVWVRIAAELRAEGLIREQDSTPLRPILLPDAPRKRWAAWWLAPVAVAVLAAGSYVIGHRPSQPVAKQTTPATPPNMNAPAPAPTESAAVPTVATSSPAPEVAKTKAPQPSVISEPADANSLDASTDDQQFLSVVSTIAPSARSTYENQLRVVNADIRETQAYVDQNPGDADARQHLMDAYQQKALLYQIALDRIQ